MRRLWRHKPFAHCKISAPSPLLFAPSCHRPAFSPRRLRPLKRPQPRFAWPLSASREGFNITTYATGYAVPVGGFFISLRAGRACPALGGLRMMFWCWPLRGMPRTPLAGARAARTPLCWGHCLGEYPDKKKAALRRLFCHCSSDSGMLFSSGG